MNCPYCNKQIPDRTQFCPHCGQTVEIANSSSSVNSYWGEVIKEDRKRSAQYGAVLSEKASQCSFARHFGTISPNVRTRKVVAPVAIAEPASPKRFIHSTVAIEEQLRFTTLLQIRIAVSDLSKWSRIYRTVFAFLLPFSA